MLIQCPENIVVHCICLWESTEAYQEWSYLAKLTILHLTFDNPIIGDKKKKEIFLWPPLQHILCLKHWSSLKSLNKVNQVPPVELVCKVTWKLVPFGPTLEGGDDVLEEELIAWNGQGAIPFVPILLISPVEELVEDRMVQVVCSCDKSPPGFSNEDCYMAWQHIRGQFGPAFSSSGKLPPYMSHSFELNNIVYIASPFP